jgi:hypothetical protein
MTGHRQIAHDALADALRQAGGNMAAAGRLLGIARATVCVRVQRSPELQRVCHEVLEENKDRWEQKLEELGMEKDSVVAVLAKLNCYARDRGYNRTQTDVMVSGDIRHHHVHSTRLVHIDTADLDRLISAKRAVLADNDSRLLEGRAERVRIGRETGGEDGED